ncbi:MAG TPA: hypothetical protein VNS12_04925 [Pelagibacterium sp.]|uniref:hypothetical protein n=1 Tax=Pelagibacterium sp. TaxID=1967288 RepID=UPI002B842223|nr:hypothetical protein [Pelagibacterium sp.]HWJ87394.1 hypothetical protein [Pelagibacterium sp.]
MADLCRALLIAGLAASAGGGAIAQDETDPAQQMMVDADALIVATQVTTRCALFDSTLAYLTPLDQAGASLRLDEIVVAASASVEDMADRLARMRADAAAITCGDEDLAPYMEFGRQIARDVIDIALVAWRSIDVMRCNYFVDDDFLVAAERARATAESTTIDGEINRVTYIEQRAAAWVDVFAANCANLGFDPVETLPGQIALALPSAP